MRMNYWFLATAVCSAFAVPQAALAAAYYFESTTTTTGDGLGRNGQVMNVRAWIDGPNAKVEFTEGDQMGFFTEGSYMLTTDGGQIIYLVNPAERTYSEMDIDQMLSMATSIMEAAGGIVKMEFSNLSNERVAEGPGEEILGYPTTRYEYRTGYTMSMGVLGFKRSMRNENQQEIWCTDDFDADAEGFRVWLSPDRLRTGNPELDELIESQYQGLDCLPLRMRTTSTTTGERGREQTTSSTMEVTVLREESSIGASAFELPAGFAAVPLLPELPADFAAPGQAEPSTEDESAEERPRLRMRDLLRR